jgi:tetratricopeptide (TPR) repeat protein
LAADAFHLLGQYNVQLRFPEEAIRAARRARGLFTALRHPVGVVSTHLTEAHAESQLGNEYGALLTVRNGRHILDNAAPRFRAIKRAECTGVAGQRLSHLQNFEAAESHLARALQLAQDVDDPRQVCLWAIRRAQNFLNQRNFAAAERSLSAARDWFERLSVGGMERLVLWRVTAGFLVATGERDEAVQWTNRAKEFALTHGLDYELVRLAPLIAFIDGPCSGDPIL